MKRIPKRILSLCMAAALVVGAMAATPAMTITAQEAQEATEAVEIPTSCPAHPEHDGDCGYVEAVAGVDCTHEHIIEGENPCGYGEAVEAQPCTFAHEHVTGNENGCGYDDENEESCTYGHQHATEGEDACDYDGEEPESCTFVHQHVTGNDDGCGYDGQNEESCTYDSASHTHDTDCGYLEGTPGTDCTHEHNEDCAYVEAVEAAPCGHSCEQCTVGEGVIMLTNVPSDDATLKKVAGQEIGIVSGGDGTTSIDPITTGVAVKKGVNKIAAGDIEVAANATVLLYSAPEFLQEVSDVSLNDGGASSENTSLYIKVTAENGTELHYHVTVTRVGSEAPEITPIALDDGMEEIPYGHETIQASGGSIGPWNWSDSGTLPAGLRVETRADTCIIKGEPQKAGDYTFWLTATQNSISSAPVEFTITIQEKSGVGFGGKEWHSIENESEKMTLLSMNHVFENSAFNSSNNNVYKGSTLQNEMGQALVGLGLSDKESDLIKTYNLVDVGVTDALFWPLSIEEAEKLPRYQRAYSGSWWLRSPGSSNLAAYVGVHGGVYSSGDDVSIDDGIRPAFQLNLASVLFTSAATGGKSATVGSTLGALAPENIYKFTMKNQTIAPTFALDTVTQKGKEVTIAYSGAAYEGGENRTVSALVENSAGIVSFYGKLKTISDADDESGSVKVTLPDGFNPANDTLQ